MGFSQRDANAGNTPETDGELNAYLARQERKAERLATAAQSEAAARANGHNTLAGWSEIIGAGATITAPSGANDTPAVLLRRVDALEQDITTLRNALTILERQYAALGKIATPSTIRPTDEKRTAANQYLTQISEQVSVNLSSVRQALSGAKQADNRWLALRRWAQDRADRAGREYDGATPLTTDVAILQMLTKSPAALGGETVYGYIRTASHMPELRARYTQVFRLAKLSEDKIAEYLAPYGTYPGEESR